MSNFMTLVLLLLGAALAVAIVEYKQAELEAREPAKPVFVAPNTLKKDR